MSLPTTVLKLFSLFFNSCHKLSNIYASSAMFGFQRCRRFRYENVECAVAPIKRENSRFFGNNLSSLSDEKDGIFCDLFINLGNGVLSLSLDFPLRRDSNVSAESRELFIVVKHGAARWESGAVKRERKKIPLKLSSNELSLFQTGEVFELVSSVPLAPSSPRVLNIRESSGCENHVSTFSFPRFLLPLSSNSAAFRSRDLS